MKELKWSHCFRCVMVRYNVRTVWTSPNVPCGNVRPVIVSAMMAPASSSTSGAIDARIAPMPPTRPTALMCRTLFTEQSQLQERRPCSPFEFECSNSVCIPRKFMCDGDNDCGDNSDETSTECRSAQCDPPLRFRCAHSRLCLNILQVCEKKEKCLCEKKG
ncbi:unnamed protein product [Nippostrongylus brasiliensis]|uniref:Low-density lipoprotein receptor domain class A n=1 Tax=Nippostrongylus brasiliensis TaxID=27835 RepID=A0A0N4XN02_NIPBR|nr:unnamed protein product [Nippostrongylus brasiliensis]